MRVDDKPTCRQRADQQGGHPVDRWLLVTKGVPKQLRIQLWSYNYDPEPSGIGPLSGQLAARLHERGHAVDVVAAHPHYPRPIWGARWRPYRQRQSGVTVLRLPIWIGRTTAKERLRQEASFVASLSTVAPLLPRPDVVIAATPSFPALAPALAFTRVRRIPLVVWVHDVLPDGAVASGLLKPGRMLDWLYRFEMSVYDAAAHVVVMSEKARDNVLAKGVPEDKVRHLYMPSPVSIGPYEAPQPSNGRRRLLIMGNLGLTQNVPAVVRAFEESGVLEQENAELRIAGDGVDAEEVRAAIRSPRVRMLGVLLREDMERELQTTTLGLVTQRHDLEEFNFPSKIQNFTARGVPLLGIVNPSSETARVINRADAGWVADSGQLESMSETVAHALSSDAELRRRGRAGYEFARQIFAPERVAEEFEHILVRSTQAC